MPRRRKPDPALGATRLYPTVTGYKTVEIQGTSMGQALPLGSLAYVQPIDQPAAGDVVTFSVQGGFVSHRVLGDRTGNGTGRWVTKGDANDAPDAAHIPTERILGKVVAYLPYLGVATSVLAKPVVLAFLVIGAALLVVLTPKKQGTPAT
ncbi:MAG: signal peptidase I [Actinomycetota bacterium]|nr:signal peptidase I [Actinomycetota bacterium]